MYEFVDRPVTCLDKGGRFLIWSIRSWTLVVRSQKCPGPTLAPAFAQWRMIGGLQPFLRLMVTLDRDALQPMRFCSLRCNRIAEDEAVLLALFAALARGETDGACRTLALLVGEDGVGDALGAVGGVATAMAVADIIPRSPDRARS
jgi:hypothetical protein